MSASSTIETPAEGVDEYLVATGQIAGVFGLVDRTTRGTVVATGADVVPLLQGIVTSDVFALAEPGSGQHSCAVNSKGRLVCDLRIVHGPDVLLLDFEPGLVEDGVVSHFRANVMSEDAKFVDRSAHTAIIGIVGAPLALLDGLAALMRPVAALGVHDATWGTLAGRDVVIRRAELVVDVLCDRADRDIVRATLVAAGGEDVGRGTMEVLRVEQGIPRWGAELDERVIPLEARLDHTIAFDKGCYVGQEIIARLDTLGTPARLLRTLVLDGEAKVGDAVLDAGKNVGEVRSIVRSPKHDAWVALAYVKRDHNAIGQALTVGDHSATVTG